MSDAGRAFLLTLLASALWVASAVAAAPTVADSTRAAPAEAAPVTGVPYHFPTARERFRAWALDALGPTAIAGDLVGASWRHWATDEPGEWDTDARGFAQRLGTGSLTTFLDESSLALGSAALRQDHAYYRAPRAGFRQRTLHALAMTVMARDREGDAVFSPAKTLAPFVGPMVTVNTLYPRRYTVGDALLSGAYSLLMNLGWNAAHEFVLGAPPWRSGRAPVR